MLVTTRGLGFAQLSDGTSKTVLCAETREEKFSSWYSGFASYGVGAWPNSNHTEPKGTTGTSTVVWTFQGTTGDSALNKGDRKTLATTKNEKWYQDGTGKGVNPHSTTATDGRAFGPSSQHPSVVQHGWGDGRASSINDAIDPDVYLHMITRNGREVDNTN